MTKADPGRQEPTGHTESIELADAYYAISDFLVNSQSADPNTRKAYAAWVAFSFKCLKEREEERRGRLRDQVAYEGSAGTADRDGDVIDLNDRRNAGPT